MKREKVGIVTEDEKKEILKLYERKHALDELSITLTSPFLSENEKNRLKGKCENDLVQVKYKFDQWWEEMSRKYIWKSVTHGEWVIDFDNNAIYLECSHECCESQNCG